MHEHHSRRLRGAHGHRNFFVVCLLSVVVFVLTVFPAMAALPLPDAAGNYAYCALNTMNNNPSGNYLDTQPHVSAWVSCHYSPATTTVNNISWEMRSTDFPWLGTWANEATWISSNACAGTTNPQFVAVCTENGGGTFQQARIGVDVGPGNSNLFAPRAGWDDLQVSHCIVNLVGIGPKPCGIEIASKTTGGLPPFPKDKRILNASVSGHGRIVSTPTGLSCRSTCHTPFDEGTDVKLTPVPDVGSQFVSWGGDCSGSAACKVAMNQDHAVSAKFKVGSGHVLDVTLTGDGTGVVESSPPGIVCRTTCQGVFANGSQNQLTQVQLTATADAGSTFVTWGGACSGAGFCTVSTDQDRVVTAEFAGPPTVKVSLVGNGQGVVFEIGKEPRIACPDDCSIPSGTGGTISLVPLATAGSTFFGWSGSCTGTQNVCEVSLDQSRTVVATFIDFFDVDCSSHLQYFIGRAQDDQSIVEGPPGYGMSERIVANNRHLEHACWSSFPPPYNGNGDITGHTSETLGTVHIEQNAFGSQPGNMVEVGLTQVWDPLLGTSLDEQGLGNKKWYLFREYCLPPPVGADQSCSAQFSAVSDSINGERIGLKIVSDGGYWLPEVDLADGEGWRPFPQHPGNFPRPFATGYDSSEAEAFSSGVSLESSVTELRYFDASHVEIPWPGSYCAETSSDKDRQGEYQYVSRSSDAFDIVSHLTAKDGCDGHL